MQYDVRNPEWVYRDRFILSKGHCSAAVAFNQAHLGCYETREIYDEYATDNCRFSMAPCRHVNPFYESSATGSLGQGLPLAVGIAAALKAKQNFQSRVYVLLGDGELQEGSNWEAIMYASQLHLDNLIAVIDNNGLQFDGKTNQINSISNVNERLMAFGWGTYDVDGHNIGQLLDIFSLSREADGPVAINARTTKGKGVSYMEDNYLWHAGRISEEQLKIAIKSIETNYKGKVSNV